MKAKREIRNLKSEKETGWKREVGKGKWEMGLGIWELGIEKSDTGIELGKWKRESVHGNWK